jgi:hypothetical protein
VHESQRLLRSHETGHPADGPFAACSAWRRIDSNSAANSAHRAAVVGYRVRYRIDDSAHVVYRLDIDHGWEPYRS